MSNSRKRERQGDDFNVSFLDVICCGFGAIVLLLMITKSSLPGALEVSDVQQQGQLKRLQQELFEIRGETRILNRELTAKTEQLDDETLRLAILKSRRQQLQSELTELANASAADDKIRARLQLALQDLNEEMERLLGRSHSAKNSLVGGIPVDSEYIIFIIDTSGSMFNYAWPRVMDEIIATLNIYPKVKGIQVMNDMGNYMFSSYRGQWIPDSPSRRKAIIKRMRTWNPFSNSSPVEGIQGAIRQYYAQDKKISLYVFGDDFSGGSIRRVIKTVERLNASDNKGERRVRIHAVGFPVLLAEAAPAEQQSAYRFAALMRELSYQNGGTFVGLNDYR
ncbi:VWA domain-containing protein [uncultured Pseudoteredinibacter sp.]|uniref:vWA domain-containing protein n=1 Tax=uncultured Pseudoteredinibacter sp. TaxID=1641701 RepID=UPI00262C3751|nr:VWA domain-containing protein [uncultured Pseudoteredinibacter sp.]